MFFQVARNDFFGFTQVVLVFTAAEFYQLETFLFKAIPVWRGFVQHEITGLFRVVLHHITVEMLGVVICFGFSIH